MEVKFPAEVLRAQYTEPTRFQRSELFQNSHDTVQIKSSDDRHVRVGRVQRVVILFISLIEAHSRVLHIIH